MLVVKIRRILVMPTHFLKSHVVQQSSPDISFSIMLVNIFRTRVFNR